MSETIKLLHTADLHLDSPLRSLALRDDRLRALVETASRTALGRIVETAIDEGARAVLIAGDLFDGRERSARTAAYVVGQFERLERAGVAVFMILGNHDAEHPARAAVEMPGNVHLFDGRGGRVRLGDADIWVHGVSFRSAHAPESLLPKFPAPVPGAINIGLLHTSLAGASEHDPYAPCSVADLVAHGFDYWALGHVHARQIHAEAPYVVMPGMPQGRDMGETGAKSATLIEVAPGGGLSLREVPTSTVEFRAVTLDARGAEDEADLRARLRATLLAAAQGLASDSAILRVTLSGATPLAWALRRDADVWEERAREIAEETGRLWIEQLDLAVAPAAGQTPGAAPEAGPGDAAAELDALMAEIRAEPGFAAAARADVGEILGLLPPARRAALMPDEAARDALADDLAEAGATLLSARLRSGGEDAQ